MGHMGHMGHAIFWKQNKTEIFMGHMGHMGHWGLGEFVVSPLVTHVTHEGFYMGHRASPLAVRP